MYYQSDGLRSIHDRQAQTFDRAARMFAHRLGRNLFGRSGRCLSIRRTYPKRQPRRAALYKARVGSWRGVKTEVEFMVTRQERELR